MIRTTLFLCSLCGAGCADQIGHAAPDAAAAVGKVATARNASDGTYTTLVDSTSMTDWTYVDFETGAEVTEADPWDLRFQRFHISTNGGVSGSGGVGVAPVTGTAFTALAAAPATGFLSDAADTDGDGLPDYAFDQGDGWYDYDVATHILTPKPIVWVVKTDGGSTLKLELEKYYNDAGTSGWFTVHWGAL